VSKPRTRAWREFRARLDISVMPIKRKFADVELDRAERYSGTKQQRISRAVQARIDRNRQPVQEESFV